MEIWEGARARGQGQGVSQGLCPAYKWAGMVRASEASLTPNPKGQWPRPPLLLPETASRCHWGSMGGGLRCPMGRGSVGQGLESTLGALDEVHSRVWGCQVEDGTSGIVPGLGGARDEAGRWAGRWAGKWAGGHQLGAGRVPSWRQCAQGARDSGQLLDAE